MLLKSRHSYCVMLYYVTSIALTCLTEQFYWF